LNLKRNRAPRFIRGLDERALAINYSALSRSIMSLSAQSGSNLVSDGENSGPNPSLYNAQRRNQTQNQARQRSGKTRVNCPGAVRRCASTRCLFRRNSTGKDDAEGNDGAQFEGICLPGLKPLGVSVGLLRGLKPPPPSKMPAAIHPGDKGPSLAMPSPSKN
jgi:hypothetical protein